MNSNGHARTFTGTFSAVDYPRDELFTAQRQEATERALLAATEAKRRRELLESSTRHHVETTKRRSDPASLLAALPADQRQNLVESLAYQDFDFARLWAEYHDLGKPDSWFFYGPGTNARRNGSFWPFYRTEQELDWLRQASRWVAVRSPHANTLVGCTASYLIGKGMTPKATPRDGTNDPRDRRLCDLVMQEIDAFVQRVEWNKLQQEIVFDTFIDGEYLLALFDMGDHLDIRQILPELVRQPPGESFEEWSYGVQCPVDDPWQRLAYHVAEYDGSRGFIVPASDVVYFPLRLPGRYNRATKRAMPLFSFGVKEAMEHAEKLMRNMGVGVTVRQGFAFMRQWADQPRDSLTDFVSSSADVQTTRTLGSTQTRNYTFSEPGRVEDAPAGMMFGALPASPETATAIEVADMLMRRGGVIINAPSWAMGASGRDQGAYASDLVRESPYVKRCEQFQEDFGSGFLRVLSRVLVIAVRCGRLPADCLTRVELTLEHPTIASRDPDKEATQNQIYVELGIKSRQQIAGELGLDWEKQHSDNLNYQRETLKAQIEIEELTQRLNALRGQQAPALTPPPATPEPATDAVESKALPTILPMRKVQRVERNDAGDIVAITTETQPAAEVTG